MKFSSKEQYTKYINRRNWLDALESEGPEDALIKLFIKYHDGPNQLEIAIDNVITKNFQELLKCCLETLQMLSKHDHSKSNQFMNQILKSRKFQKLFTKELDIMEKKYKKISTVRECQIENDRNFVDYFLKFAKSYSQIQPIQNIQRQMNDLKESVIFMNRFINFNDELIFIKDIEDQKVFENQPTMEYVPIENPLSFKYGEWIEDQFQIKNQIIESEKSNFQITISNQKIPEIAQMKQKEQKFMKQQYQQKQKIKEQSKATNSSNNSFSLESENELIDKSSVSYMFCSIEPSYQEFNRSLDQTVYGGKIFKIPIQKPYPNTSVYLNNNFFILREDYVKNFRATVQQIKKNGFMNSNLDVIQNVFLYYSVLVENILVTNKGLQFVITMNVYDPKNRKINWKRTKRLMPGSLLMISCVNLENMLFGTVYEKPQIDHEGRVNVLISLIGLTTRQQLEFVNMILSTENQLIVAENQVYYEAYTHFLNCLKKKKDVHFPFKEQIVSAQTKMSLPGYLDFPKIRREGIEYEIDLKFNLHQQKQIGKMSRINILREWRNINSESLDKSQLKAIQIMLRNGITLIQGPPGTGKTFCGALGVRILLQNQFKWNKGYEKINKPILIVCQTNHALDQFLQHILTFCDKRDVVRLGGRCKVAEFQEILLQNNQQDRKIQFRWKDFLDLRDDLDQKLRNLLNLIDNVDYQDVELFLPKLADLIVNQYLETTGLDFQKSISKKSRRYIIHMWLDTFLPKEQQAEKIIDIEQENGNKLLNKKGQKRAFKPTIVFRRGDLKVPIKLNEDAYKAFEAYEDEEVDENEFIDSEEEENRKNFGLDDGEKNQFVDQLIKDKISMNRLLNRLGEDNKNQFYKILKEDLNHPDVIVWNMVQSKRNVITRFIFAQKFIKIFNELKDSVVEYDKYLEDLQQAYIERDLQYIQTKKIVGVTLSGCAKYAEKLQNLKFNILIVEEAGEVLESKLVSVLTRNINHLILIGDHQQLKPHLECYDLEVKYRANISLFERLIRNGLEYVTLTQQRRMKTKFADFIRLIYSNYEDHYSIQEQNKLQIQGVSQDLLFFDHIKLEENELFRNSKSNKFEAEMIIKFTDYLLLNQTKPSQITVLCTYVKQALRLQKKVQYGIKVQTVDNYQGEENDIIILSLVRSNKQLKLGFVGIDNRVCVAFSRARIGFYIFGDFEFIELSIKKELSKPQSKRNPDTSDLWLKIISLAKQKNVMFDYLTLNCSSHNEITKIYTVQDWNKVKGGGCQKTCLKQFPCGHVCKKKCHQSTHKQEDCQEQCEKMLSCGHQCRGECRFRCPACIVQVEKTIPKCQHKLFVNCSDYSKETQCYKRCQKLLSCGHQCTLKCFDECNKVLCYEEIEITLNRCKHKLKIKCSDQKYQDLLICQQNCQEQLLCGHNCQGKCGTCFEKFHQPCKQKCDKILNCGHQCQQLCKLECYECKQKCYIECNCGDKCSLQCNKECRQCQNPCKLSCQHSKCNKKCFELCDRNPCNQRCQNALQCGCQCMGYCGENCPNICLDSTHNTKLADEDAIYYQLECQCNLIMKARDLDNYFNKIDISRHIKCPGCDSILWKSSRYQDKIKQFKLLFKQQKSDKRLQYEITQDRLEDLKDLVQLKLKFIQEKNIKDEMSFLDDILQEIKSNLQLMKDFKDSKLTYQEFICIKAQLDLYQQTLKLKEINSSDKLFKVHRQNLINEYLLNEAYRQSFTGYHQWKVEQKLKSLLLYSDLENRFQQTSNKQFQQICFEIQDSHFFLDESKYNEFIKKQEEY